MVELILKDIMEVAGYLPISILCGLAAVIIYFVFVYVAGKSRKSHSEEQQAWKTGNVIKSVVLFMLIVYMVVLVITVFFSREPGSRQGVDMTFLGTWGVTPQEHAFVIENILLFVPFGILFPAATSDRLGKYTIIIGALVSVLIESVQLLTQRGYCQLDDVVMNTFGTILGFLLWKACVALKTR